MVATRTKVRAAKPLAGENLKTKHWEDARHWMSIYADLLEFKRGILARVSRDLAPAPPGHTCCVCYATRASVRQGDIK